MCGGFQLPLPERIPEGVRPSNESAKAKVSGSERNQSGHASNRPQEHWVRERP